jgi:hypothetical protein
MAPTTSLQAASRAAWLSELSKAIDEAQWLAWRIGVVEGRNAQALELYVQLELVRVEIEAIWSCGPAAQSLDSLGDIPAPREGFKE